MVILFPFGWIEIRKRYEDSINIDKRASILTNDNPITSFKLLTTLTFAAYIGEQIVLKTTIIMKRHSKNNSNTLILIY